MLVLQLVQHLLQLLHLLLRLNLLLLQLGDLQLSDIQRLSREMEAQSLFSCSCGFYLEGLRDVFAFHFHALPHQLLTALIIVYLEEEQKAEFNSFKLSIVSSWCSMHALPASQAGCAAAAAPGYVSALAAPEPALSGC